MDELKILSLSWNRIYLIINFNKNISKNLYLVCGDKKELILKEYINNKEMRLPITCAYSDTMIESGEWYFLYNNQKVKIDLNEALKLEDKSKVYFYKKYDYAYIVSFNVDESCNLIMNVNYMMKNTKPKRKDRITCKCILLHKCSVLATNLIEKLFKLEYNIFSLLHRKKKNRILFMSETRDGLAGNLKALENRLKERNLDSEYKFYYSFKKVLSDKKSLGYYIKTINLLSKVDYIFIDDYAPIFNFIDLKNTKLIQLWHAGVGFKSVGYSRFGKEGSPHPLISPHRKYDYATVASPNLIETYQEVFGITRAHFLVPGMLRLDGYLDSKIIEDTKKNIYDKYPDIKNKEVILFAPTYRGTGQSTAFYDYDKINLKKLSELCERRNYIVLFKFHPFIKNKIKIDEKYSDYMIDVSDYKDINELFYITDVLITDYSSNIYEYSLFEKPIIFYDYDMYEYVITRGVHEDLNNSPGNICKTFDEVLDILNTKKFDINKVKEFKRKNISYCDSKSCDRLIEMLFNK